jgi:hypothetical protein
MPSSPLSALKSKQGFPFVNNQIWYVNVGIAADDNPKVIFNRPHKPFFLFCAWSLKLR